MPRMARKKLTDKYYFHVIVQGINRVKIFINDTYINKYLELIIKKSENKQVLILAYCVMNNHAQLLVYSEKIEYLSKYMQRLNLSYSNFYNKMEKRVGYVFRDRFHCAQIKSQKQLYNCLKYIHNNPVKANICESMNQYKYSSYNEFINGKIIIDKKSVELLFENDKNYLEIFKIIHSTKNDEQNDFYDLKEENILEIICTMENEYGIKRNSFKNDKAILKKVINEARSRTDITIVDLAKLLSISKNTIFNYEKREPSHFPKKGE